MSDGYRIVVLIKQVPDTSSKAGVNPDGTIDRARAKRMLNTFDKYALQKALEVKAAHGGEVLAISMGPPPALEILVEACEYGADKGYLLTDRRLAASDTLSTAYALHKAVQYLGRVDLVFTGLQTTDGDTAQTGPQIAERLDLPQITYCERLEIVDGKARVRRVVEGGYQWLETPLPALITVANSATKLQHKRFGGVYAVKELQRHKERMDQTVFIVDLDKVGADSNKAGLVGSPTVVGKTWKMGEIGGSCVMFLGDSPKHNVEHLMARLKEDNRHIEELIQ
ncbi:MAG: electron transfer flavoprotein subunit beta/FixA family protein [Nitrospinae bacterium]|nr:electron transfer flavoprotein subunit beta/FixA family protein [Nitrospinota bacterium]